MMTIADIYEGAERLINQKLREEMIAQGHHLSGAMEASLSSAVLRKGKTDIMEGSSVYYTKFVNEGFPAESASFKQFPFLLEYFIQKGYPVHSSSGGLTAPSLAAMTIRKWMKEGMPTAASSKFSQVTRRKLMIENAFQDGKQELDQYMNNSFDFMVEERFQKEKTETI